MKNNWLILKLYFLGKKIKKYPFKIIKTSNIQIHKKLMLLINKCKIF